MESRDEILKELMEIAPKLSTLNKINTFSVPEGYFAAFKNAMHEQIKTVDAKQELTELAPQLAQLNKAKQEEIPTAYFKGFSANVLNKIRLNEVAEELAEVAPLLGSLPKVNVYQAPANYFNTLPQQMANAVTAQTKVVQQPIMPKWLVSINMVLESIVNVVFKPRYSMVFASVVTILIVGVMMFTKTEQTTLDLNKQFASLTNEDLDAYFSAHPDEFSKSILDVSTDDSKLLKRSAKGDLSFDSYAIKGVSDDELYNAILD